jgi:hypothetical protein
MTRSEEIDALILELSASDDASALTNRAARVIDVLYRELIAAKSEIETLYQDMAGESI